MRLPRFFWWGMITLLLGGVVYHLSPQQFPVMLYKVNLVALAAVISYWIDRSLFVGSIIPRLTDNMPRDLATSARLVARAMVYVGTVLGLTLGL